MSIKYVMLGFLSEMPLTGYDLKKKFSDSEIFYWSGNNNQVYRTLSELHQENLVTVEVQYQESKPPRKIYTITDAGRAALRQWMLSPPELPQFRSALLEQLMWAEQLEPNEVKELLGNYEDELRVHLLMLQEQARRRDKAQSQTRLFRDRIFDHWITFYEFELTWVDTLRQEMSSR